MRLENAFLSLLAEPQVGNSCVPGLKATDPMGELLHQLQTFQDSGNNSLPLCLKGKGREKKKEGRKGERREGEKKGGIGREREGGKKEETW